VLADVLRKPVLGLKNSEGWEGREHASVARRGASG
jgi:hypothetical protein